MAVDSLMERTGRRARDPDPLRGQGPLPLGQDPRPP